MIRVTIDCDGCVPPDDTGTDVDRIIDAVLLALFDVTKEDEHESVLVEFVNTGSRT